MFTVPLNIVACGGGSSPKPIPQQGANLASLLKLAKTKINDQFSKLVNDYSNLMYENQVESGATVLNILNNNDDNKPITDETTREAFFQIIRENIKKINTKLAADADLKALFTNSSDFLKLEATPTILTKNKFVQWKQNEAFGIKDYTPDKFKITDWFAIGAQLDLIITYKDEDGKQTTTNYTQTYHFYFANTGALVNKVVDAATAYIETTLKGQVIQTIIPNLNLSFADNKTKILNDINEQLAKIINNKKLEIGINELNDNYDFHYLLNLRDGTNHTHYFPLVLANSPKYFTNSDKYRAAWEQVISAREKNFASVLNRWISDNKITTITNKEQVFAIGTYHTTNRTISGLTIKTIDIFHYVYSDIIRTVNINNSLEIMTQLFTGSDRLLKYNENFNIIGSNGFTFILNPSVYDKFIGDNATVKEVYEYITTQTKTYLTKKGLITVKDEVQWRTSWNVEKLNRPITTWYKPAISKTKIFVKTDVWLVINGNAFLNILQDATINFVLDRANTNVWPSE